MRVVAEAAVFEHNGNIMAGPGDNLAQNSQIANKHKRHSEPPRQEHNRLLGV